MFPFAAHLASPAPGKAPERVLVIALVIEGIEPRFLYESRGRFDTAAVRHVERVPELRRADKVRMIAEAIAEAQAHGRSLADIAEHVATRLWSMPTATGPDDMKLRIEQPS